MLKTLDDVAVYLESLINYEKRQDYKDARFGLDAIRELLGRVGNPHESLRVIHIAGSKGKGSVALLVEALLQAVGLRVGTFTSPHLSRWTERFRIDGQDVGDEELLKTVRNLQGPIDVLRRQAPIPTFFDATTAIALTLISTLAGRLCNFGSRVGRASRLNQYCLAEGMCDYEY